MNKSIDIVLPVYNESKNLEKRFIILYEYMIKHFQSGWVITIAENGSNDNTLQIAKVLQSKYKNSRVISNSWMGQKFRYWCFFKMKLLPILCFRTKIFLEIEDQRPLPA